jgi:hypothetical protein
MPRGDVARTAAADVVVAVTGDTQGGNPMV